MITAQPALAAAYRPTSNPHRCYFCHPELYPPMPAGDTLCARCGTYIHTGHKDPHNEAMWTCGPCELILEMGR